MTQNVPNASIVKPLNWLRGIALLCACALLHCGGPIPSSQPDDPAQPPAQLALSPSNAQIAQGTAEQFSLRGFYEDGSVRDLTSAVKWTVTNENGRTVPMPPDGYLQLDGAGRYEVTASYRGSSLSTPIIVSLATVKSIAVSPRLPRVAKGLTQSFTATATFDDDTTQDVTKLATWAVKDTVGTSVATIDTTGILFAKNLGKAQITARYKSRSSSTTVEVTTATLIGLVVSPANPAIARGTNQRFTATGSYSDGTSADVTTAATWAVTDLEGTGVAAIDGVGIANGKAVGLAQVSAEYNGLVGETTLTVNPATPISIALSPASSSVAKGTTRRFVATATLTDGTTQDVSTMAAWTASDRTGTGVASVDGTGLAKGNAIGTATINCAYRGNTASAQLEVTAAVLTGLRVTPATGTMYKGQYASLVATGLYSDGSTQDLSATVTWTTTDLVGTDVASVAAGGRVFGKNLGKAQITALSGLYTASAELTVAMPTYTKLTVSPNSTITIQGLSMPFSAIATRADGTTQDVTTMATWSAIDLVGTKVASVNSKGDAMGLSSGLAEIRASFNGYTASGQLFVF